MQLDSSNSDYSAKHIGTKMQFFYKSEFQCELIVRSNSQARQLLASWARLQIPPTQVKLYHGLIEGYVGATVDDVTVSDDGKTYYINGKSLAII